MKILMPALLLLALAGCAPSHYMIERADVGAIEQRLDHLDVQLSEFEVRQASDHEHQSLENRMASAALMQTMVAEFARLFCETHLISGCADASSRDEDEDEKKSPRRVRPPILQIDDKQVIGGIEQVLLSPPGLLFEARVDTGAESASLDARDMQEFERDGNRWVRFSMVNRETNEIIEIERRIVRHVRILQSTADEAERRPVVEFRLTLGEFTQTAEFTLSDRSHLSFPVLIGRNVLQDVMIVDVGRAHIAPPSIPPPDNSD